MHAGSGWADHIKPKLGTSIKFVDFYFSEPPDGSPFKHEYRELRGIYEGVTVTVPLLDICEMRIIDTGSNYDAVITRKKDGKQFTIANAFPDYQTIYVAVVLNPVTDEFIRTGEQLASVSRITFTTPGCPASQK
jgi:hypothetical protein